MIRSIDSNLCSVQDSITNIYSVVWSNMAAVLVYLSKKILEMILEKDFLCSNFLYIFKGNCSLKRMMCGVLNVMLNIGGSPSVNWLIQVSHQLFIWLLK